MGNGHDQPQEEPNDLRPFLFIPYWKTKLSPTVDVDNGTVRPLPSSIISYDCKSIKAGPYSPGSPLSVTVDIGNAGKGNQSVLATVTVYWGDPTVGFVKPSLLGVSLVPVPPRGGTNTTQTITGTIPPTAPSHICLLVAVSHPLDPAGPAINPSGDRHWAQRNLVAVNAAAGVPVQFPFMAANQLREDMRFQLIARPINERHIGEFNQQLGLEYVDAVPRVHIADSGGQVISQGERESTLELELRAGESQRLLLAFELERDLEPGQFSAVEVLLNHPDVHGEHDTLTAGSLGVIILPPE